MAPELHRHTSKMRREKPYNVLSVDVTSMVRKISRNSCREAGISAPAVPKMVCTDA